MDKHTPTISDGIIDEDARIVQNFLLIWLDGTINGIHNNDYCNTITQLRQMVNTVNVFTSVDECIDFIRNTKEEKIFIISSGTLGQIAVPIIHDMAQINSIYIFCQNKTRHEEWSKQWSKVKNIFTEMAPLYEALKQDAYDCDRKTISMSFMAPSDDLINKNLDQLDKSFMNTYVLEEILLTINFQEEHFEDCIFYLHEQFIFNTLELPKYRQI